MFHDHRVYLKALEQTEIDLPCPPGMAGQRTLLDYLRSRSLVDCDTFDASVAELLGPFQDSTSNQAIAYFELDGKNHGKLIQRALTMSQSLSGERSATQAVDIAMTMLAIRMLPHLKGTTHIQVNPVYSHSISDVLDNARAIVSYVRAIDPLVDVSRICIKIPSTWEGLQACRILEKEGIKTLATTLFCAEQAALAAQVGCSYIAPYINELRVHFDADYRDANPGFSVVPWAQEYNATHAYKTQVLPASLTSVKEVMALAGADHITIAPNLLQQLHEIVADEQITEIYPSVFDRPAEALPSTTSLIEDQTEFERALAQGDSGRKLREAIQIFCDFQLRLERIFKDAVEEAQ